MPAFALASLDDGCSIEPVRSSTIMTSSGRPPHGEHACACTLSVIVLMPISRRKYVGMFAVSVMCTVFAGLQKFALVEQSSVMLAVTLGTPTMRFFAVFSALRLCAAAVAVAVLGRLPAPAATAASAEAWRACFTRYALPMSMTAPQNRSSVSRNTTTSGSVCPEVVRRVVSSVCDMKSMRYARGESRTTDSAASLNVAHRAPSDHPSKEGSLWLFRGAVHWP